MATQTMYKVIFNGAVMPDIYFLMDSAKAALNQLKESSCAGFGRIVLYDDQTGELGN